jgi:hypothetical protein
MNQSEYLSLHESVCQSARQLSAAKNNDYASPDRRGDDPLRLFANFLHCERLGLCTVEQGIMVRVSDKVARMSNLIHPDHTRTVDESLDDTVKDTINYLVLLLAYRKANTKLNGANGGLPE